MSDEAIPSGSERREGSDRREGGERRSGTDRRAEPDAAEIARTEAALRFLRSVHEAFRAMRQHRIESQQVLATLDELTRCAAAILESQGSLTLRVVHQLLYVNEVRLRMDLDNYVYFGHVLDVLQRTGAGVIQVEPTPDPREWRAFVSTLLQFAGADYDPSRIHEIARAASLAQVRLISAAPPPEGDAAFPDDVERKRAAKRTYEQSIAVSRELFEGSRMGRAAQVKQIKHAVQNIVDQVLSNEASLGSLSALKDYDDYAFTHAVNVCIFCVAIGRRLGLTKAQLYDLGFAALVHDVGMSRIPTEILVKGEGLTEEERGQMQAHTWLGAMRIFDLRDYGQIPYQGMIAAYEHHMKMDLSGYPKALRARQPSMFSKIIAVASAFDAATNTRAYTEARPPDEVLREFWENRSLGFDPVIVKALINLLGIYPVGTVVILDTFELGLVHAPNSDGAYIHRPIVRILSGPEGVWLTDPPLVDLADTDEQGTFRRSIIKVTSAAKYGITVADYFR